MIETVRGAVEADALGFTLMHEHIFNLNSELVQNYGEAWFQEDQQIEEAVKAVSRAADCGVGTIVDLTVLGLGRYIPRILQVADKVRLNIIVATGIYAFRDLPVSLRFRGPGTVSGGADPMVDMFRRDIQEGIGDTGVRAGILKVATDRPGVTPDNLRMLRAVGLAQTETGVPISTHTHDAPNGVDQLSVFKEVGVDLSRVVIGHIDLGSRDLDYAKAIMDQGASIGFDRWGMQGPPFSTDLTDKDRAERVAALCSQGYGDRIVLSHDSACFTDSVLPEVTRALWPDWKLDHLSRTGIPLLLSEGVSDEDITAMTISNPRRILAPVTQAN